MTGIDPDLLESPYDEPAPKGRGRAPAVAIGLVIVIGVTATAWVLAIGNSDSGDNEALGGTTTTTVPPRSLALVAYAPDTAFLTHPTLLPEGWDACSVTEDRFEPDRFCPDGGDQWVEVAYAVPRPSDPETAVPAGSHDGEWVSESDPLELRFPINEHVSGMVRAHGLEADQILQIAESVPIITDRASLYANYELPIDWEALTDDDVVDLLDQFEGDATVDLQRWSLGVRTSNASLYGFNTRASWTPAAATDLPMARLVADADRPLVVGAAPALQKGYAVWDQAGMAWRLEGNLDADEATALALSVIAKLAALPLDMSR